MQPRLEPARLVWTHAIDASDFFQSLNEDADPRWTKTTAARSERHSFPMTAARLILARDCTTAINVGLAFAPARQEAEHDEDIGSHRQGRGQKGIVFAE